MGSTGRVLGLIAMLGVAACDRNRPVVAAPDATPTAKPAAAPAAKPPARLEDLVEQTPTYLIGVTYPKSPLPAPVADAMRKFASDARERLVSSAKPHKVGDAGIPYDMSLEFKELPGMNAALRTFAADGSLYTGGERGEPLIRRYVWLARDNHILTSSELLADANGWKAISDAAQASLLNQAKARMEENKRTPAEEEELLKSMAKLVAAGTVPDAANFSEFEPVVDSQGKITGLTFVFPPYQVSGYADGTQRADVPASVFVAMLNPRYRDLFAP